MLEVHEMQSHAEILTAQRRHAEARNFDSLAFRGWGHVPITIGMMMAIARTFSWAGAKSNWPPSTAEIRIPATIAWASTCLLLQWFGSRQDGSAVADLIAELRDIDCLHFEDK